LQDILPHASLNQKQDVRRERTILEDGMVELLRTNDLVLISLIEAILADEGIDIFVADAFMSALEGSLGFLPRRIFVHEDLEKDARSLLEDAGLALELRRG
jgi:hypothetical protein